VDRRQHPANFDIVAGVVSARQLVQLTAAAAKVRHHATPADRLQVAHQGARVVRRRVALESVKENDQWRRARLRRRCIEPVEIDEIAVESFQPLATQRRSSSLEQRRIDRLRMGSREPRRRLVAHAHRFNASSRRPTMVRRILIRA
jgi:hypothetical protein